MSLASETQKSVTKAGMEMGWDLHSHSRSGFADK